MKKIILIAALIFLSIYGIAQNNVGGLKYPFKLEIQKIDSLINIGQPKSALKLLLPLKAAAEKDGQTGYFVVAVQKEIELNSQIKDDNSDSAKWNAIEKEISKLKYPNRAHPFLHLYAANLLNEKFNQNRWNTNNKDDNSTDWNNWSNEKLVKLIEQHCYSAFMLVSHHSYTNYYNWYDEKLKPLIQDYEEATIPYTVEQMVILEIIERLSNIELTADNTYKSPSKEESLAPLEAFRMTSFNLNNDPKNEYYILHFYQELAGCIGDDETEKRIIFDLKRLNYAKQFDNTIGKLVWLKAIENLFQANKDNAYSNLVAAELVNYYKETNKVKARQIAKDAIAKYPNFKFNAVLENSVLEIEQTFYSLITENIAEPNKAILAKLDYTNINKVYIQVLKLDYLKYFANNVHQWDEDKALENLIAHSSLFDAYTIEIPVYNDFSEHSAELALKALPKGQYIFIASERSDSAFEKKQFSQSSIVNVSEYTVLQYLDSNKFQLVNAKEGDVEENIPYKIFYYNRKWNTKEEIALVLAKESKTDKNGVINLSDLTIFEPYSEILINIGVYDFFYGDYINYNIAKNEKTVKLSIQLFTDRNLYRPGQTVYFKGIVFNNEKKQVVANETVEVVLKDINYQEKGKLSLKTNKFGSIADSFVLPMGGSVTGSFHMEAMSVNIANNATYFSVEEYKRQKYSAEIVEPTTAFKLGDLVKIQGKAHAYAGYAVQGANVSYSVTRSLKPKYYWWGYRGMLHQNSESLVILNGETKTNETGFFDIEFTAIPDESINAAENPYFNYEIIATITDLNGEVRQASYALTLAYTNIELSIGGAEKYLANSPISLNIAANNLQGKSLPLNAEIRIEKQQTSSKIYRKRFWAITDTVAFNKKEFEKLFPDYEYPSNPEFTIIEKSNLNNYTNAAWSAKSISDPGTYKATVFAKDANGKMLSESFVFEVVPNKKGKYKEPKVLDIILLNGADFEPQQTAKFLIASGTEAAVNIVVKSNRGEILNKSFELCKKSKLIEIPILEEDRGNIEIMAYSIHNYRYYEHKKTLIVPFSNKQLEYTIQSIRDKTEPGAKEKWVLTIKGNDANKVVAEHIANMYDQSLDALNYANEYQFWPHSDFFYNGNVFENHFGMTNSSSFHSYINYSENDIYLHEPYFIGLARTVSYRDGNFGYMFGSIRRESASHLGTSSDSKLSFLGSTSSETPLMGDIEVESTASNIPPPIRQNFNETAFFFPQMLTNDEGDLLLEFTMPESLTQWKLMLLGHTTDLKIGTYTQSITASKKMMAQPNIPRFLREMDTISIATKIVNTTNKDFATTVSLLLTDGISGEKLDWLQSGNNMMISVPGNSSRSVSFDIAVPNFTGIVDIAIMSQAGNYTDGELHTIPVLTNRKLITETLPITVTEKGTQNLVFKSLKENKSTTLTHHNFTLELSSNPAWYAVQSLPYLIEFPHECAEQTFSRLYADLLANHIAKNNPNIQPMIKKWETAAKKDSSILLSKLKTNQDLKYTVIEETPWLLDANKESERMQKLALLFDAKRIDQNKQIGLERLKELQSDNGGWSWFAGMQPNVYITQTIVIGFGKLKNMGIDIAAYNEMITKAMNFLDADAQRMYDYYTKQKDKGYTYEPSNLQYLYCKSYFPKMGFDAQNIVVTYFVANTEKQWINAGLMQKAQLVTALKVLNPQSKLPAMILKSLTENAQNSKEMGMYWKQNNGGYYWYQSAIETQAAIIEAYSSAQAAPSIITQQQIWLLRQKQTQNWKTTRATADACYALLMSGSNWLNSPLQIEATVNNTTVNTANGQPGTGYIKEQIPVNKIDAQTANINITASSNNFGYGAAYWQYFENLEKIKNTASGIVIDKKIYKIVNTPLGEKKILIGEKDSLQIGDRIEVSINVSSDRNLEYVHIKDLRGSGTEPVDVLSGYKWQSGAGFYQTTLDASTNFFIDYLSKGNYQFNYQLTVQQAGVFSCGLATAQCMYAPEYVGNSKSIILKVLK